MNTKQSNFTSALYSWLIFTLSAGFLFYKYVIEVSPSVMGNELMKEFHIHGAELGNLASSYFYAYLIMQLPVGLLLDKFGPRRLTTIAIFLCAMGAFFLAHASSFTLACLGRFISGTGAAFAAISCLKLISIWFKPNRFAFMAGLMMTAGMLGAVGGEAPLAASIAHWGWRETLISTAFIGVIFCIAFFCIVRDTNENNELLANEAHKNDSFVAALVGILKKPQNWYLSIYSGLAFAPVAVIGGLWGVPFLHEAYGLSKTVAASQISLVFIGFAVGAPTFGILSDYIGLRKPLIYFGTTVAIILMSIIVYLSGLSDITLSCLFFGLGFFISAFLISFTMIREINHLKNAATSVAMMNTLNAALCAISDPLIGKFLDITWTGKVVNGAPVFDLRDYHIAFSALPIYLIVAMFLLFFVKETHCKQQ